MNYRDASVWDEKNEIRCLIIFKKLQANQYRKGKQAVYCREMSLITKISPSIISAKVSVYKSVAGVNNATKVAVNTVEVYKKYGHLSAQELEKLIL